MRRIMITRIVFQAVLLRIALSQSTTEVVNNTQQISTVASVASSAAIQSNSAVAQSTVVIPNGAASLSNGVTVQPSSVGTGQSDSSQVNMASMSGSITNVQPTASVHQSSIADGNAPSVSTSAAVTANVQPTTAVASGQSQSHLASTSMVGNSVNSNNTAVQPSDTKTNSVAPSPTLNAPASSSVGQGMPKICSSCLWHTNMTEKEKICNETQKECPSGQDQCTDFHIIQGNFGVHGKGCAVDCDEAQKTTFCQTYKVKYNLNISKMTCDIACCKESKCNSNSDGYIAVQAANSAIILLFALSVSLYSLV